ncbi:thioredoxin-disulfide reductase [Candidatus Methylacidiphilum fumarolicum]|uniref:Thioredoxin reductase n=2 Tax=Candidatus Methylacidiphilum fumarolicum TaxID=591154 RepID=I0JWI9_METFB|nr:thioredoxin-disulfide reductase [Candidatus Methylacidiphilum fumarolicum]MBW6415342.1 thioredoxin-disulfide reductase [Candidatus Methylacidiphilum fumarolicum]TFE68671.1 thioredoxin-disulfide reductase [Candidatus Methylacidiphilum fumarolicum]TFE72570.1 thioredoxin-disulfide reductase [Candidatus Methylacidiphilum fumarolicum]TFE73887.1 thioredoxin-disulfide reductase [Candidatus Methylacidiphilum fumarolicum]TFE77508.1 thioredoxin-disulfide reductase [Candidatus Methylacidiphilum fumaro
MEEVIIIGSGCAGWTAAIYLARAKLSPLLVTGSEPGGLLTTTTLVENYPGFPLGIQGPELMEAMRKQAERFGTRVKYLSVVTDFQCDGKIKRVKIDDEWLETKAVVIAVGARPRKLSVPGESELETKGVSYCATCDGALPVFRNQPLVVVGGGDSACEEALYLTRFASVVYLVHRRNALRASSIMAERVLNEPKIKVIWNSVIEKVLDPKQDRVTGVVLRNVKEEITNLLECRGLFVAIGHVPNTQIFEGKIELDEKKLIKTTEGTRTSMAGVFACGDCVDGVYRQAVTAAGMGCMAAIDAERYLREKSI